MPQSEAHHEDANPHKQLLVQAAAQLRKDEEEREKRRPQNVGQGAVGLVGDSLGGAAIGAAAVVMGPVHGFKERGAKGILEGAIGGLAVGVTSATLGIVSGVTKFAQGASRTADKISKPSTPDQRLGISQDTLATGVFFKEKEALYAELLAKHATASAAADAASLQPPVENAFYDVLAVSPDATQSQIRKAYYRMAQRYHPDKHPDDPQAKEKFQAISDAYQVLSDPVKREEYHRLGASAAANDGMMDPKALFALMFSDFEHIVGDLATATILSTMGDSPDPSETTTTGANAAQEARLKKRKEFQTIREAHLVELLNRRLRVWVDDEEAFISHAKHEVIAMRAEPFGRDLLHTVGYIYGKKAAKVLGQGPFKGVTQVFDDIGDKAHRLRTQIRALEGGVKALSASAETGEEGESLDEAARREAVSTLGAVWLASVVDIETTLRSVVSVVLEKGEKVKSPEAMKKAQGLAVLSKIFEQA